MSSLTLPGGSSQQGNIRKRPIKIPKPPSRRSARHAAGNVPLMIMQDDPEAIVKNGRPGSSGRGLANAFGERPLSSDHSSEKLFEPGQRAASASFLAATGIQDDTAGVHLPGQSAQLSSAILPFGNPSRNRSNIPSGLDAAKQSSGPYVQNGTEVFGKHAATDHDLKMGEQRPGFRKRSADDDSHGRDDSKRPKQNGQGDGSGSFERLKNKLTANDAPENPCEQYRTALKGYDELLEEDSNPGELYPEQVLTKPALEGKQLDIDDTIFDAIAAVTEAIVQAGGPCHTLVDPARYYTNIFLARPGHDILLPYTIGGNPTDSFRPRGGHIELFVFRVDHGGAAGPSFRVETYESARHISLGSPVAEPSLDAYKEGLGFLKKTNWLGNNTAATVEQNRVLRKPVAQPAPVQTTAWTCGLHAIFTAWAIALGLQINTPVTMQDARFYKDGVSLVNYSLYGLVSSQDIRNFLACYKFITPNSIVPANRLFTSTVAILGSIQFTKYVVTIRLDEELAELRKTDPTVPPGSISDLLRTFEEMGVNTDHISELTAVELTMEYRSLEEIWLLSSTAAEVDTRMTGTESDLPFGFD